MTRSISQPLNLAVPCGATWTPVISCVLLNQVLVIGALAAISSHVVDWSLSNATRLEFAVSDHTRLFYWLGPSGMILVAILSIVVTTATLLVREYVASIVVASFAFSATAAFLTFGIYYSLMPFFEAIGNPTRPYKAFFFW